jgi:DNA-binding NtrC family response regulator
MAAKVLVVDDDKHIRDLLSSFLTTTGYEVIWASNGEEAIRLANSQIPNAIHCHLKSLLFLATKIYIGTLFLITRVRSIFPV